MNKFFPALVIASFVFLTGCSQSRITSSWKAPDASGKSFQKILVLGLIREEDRLLQQKMEEHLAADLGRMGYQAESALKVFGPKAFDKMNEDEALSQLRNSGFDAVLTIVLLDKEKEKRYVAGNVYYSPYSIYYRRFWGYRSTLYFRIYEPGYYVTDTRYFWESNFYELANQRLLYSAQSKSFDPANAETMGHTYGLMLTKDLVKQEVLSGKTQSSKAF